MLFPTTWMNVKMTTLVLMRASMHHVAPLHNSGFATVVAHFNAMVIGLYKGSISHFAQCGLYFLYLLICTH